MFRQLIGGTLALAGVRPEFTVEAEGQKAFHGHVVSFTDKIERKTVARPAAELSWKDKILAYARKLLGQMESKPSPAPVAGPDKSVRYLGIIREYSGGEPEEAFTVRLPRKFCVYDARAGKYLGETDSINAVLYSGAAKVYALMPQEMNAPELTCVSTVQRGAKFTGNVALAGPRDAHRVVKIEICDPAGKLRDCYSGPQIIPPGADKAGFGFTLAWNDPVGTWTVKAVELISGKTAERKFIVAE
jgi:hypothetical protein